VGLSGKLKPNARKKSYNDFVAMPDGVLFSTDVAARGVDIADIHWIVNYDAPADDQDFIHRIGRTARMGRSGNALTFLMPNEEAFLPFLQNNKNITMEKYEAKSLIETSADELNEMVRQLALGDRKYMEQGVRAFVSYIRAYRTHKCSGIFNFDELKIGPLARGMGIPYLPKMKDFRSSKVDFTPPDYNPDGVAFKDPEKEAKRQQILSNLKAQREQKKAERDANRKAKEEAPPKRRRKRIHEEMKKEWEELADDIRFHKKLKKGKITKQELDELLGEHIQDEYFQASGGKQKDNAENPPKVKKKSAGGKKKAMLPHLNKVGDNPDISNSPKEKKRKVEEQRRKLEIMLMFQNLPKKKRRKVEEEQRKVMFQSLKKTRRKKKEE